AAGLSLGHQSWSKTGQTKWNNPFTGEWYLYQLPDTPMKARLLANENPYGPSEKAKQALVDALPIGNRYSWDIANELRKIIADNEGLTPEHVILSAGSLEVLNLVAIHYGLQKGNLISAFPTFEPLMLTAAGLDCDWEQVLLDQNHRHDLAAMEAKISADTRLVYVCNPNNPTGTLLDPTALKDFCRKAARKVPLFVDEAYTEFLEKPEDHTIIPLIKEGHNLIVAKTFSKIHGFAGLRIGYALAQPETWKEMKKYRPYETTMAGPTLKAAIASYQDQEFQHNCRDKNTAAKNYTLETLRAMGYEPVPSYTSFMIFPIKMKPDQFIKDMRAQGVGIRSWSFADKDWCRVSIGTMEEMKIFTEALKTIS
ncbi:MAG: pyridoxal phosphate-dependent aminotransferase, partial [Cyclobacteriaceae bacterium]